MAAFVCLCFFRGLGFCLFALHTATTNCYQRREMTPPRTFAVAAIALFALLVPAYSSAQTIKCTTWNLEWFPNGSAHEASAAQQDQRIKEAADVLRAINPDIVLLQEVRDYDACSRLGEAIAPGIYHVAICSAFKEPFQRGLGKQQVAILSRYQAQAAWAEPWKSVNGVDPPRGFAFAWFKIGNEDIGVYSLHLKSNLVTHGDKEAETAKNIQKREIAIAQLLTHVRDVIETTMPTIKGVVIGGDFNTNHDQAMFAAERTLDAFVDAGYENGFEALSLSQRVTHPGTHGFPDATFDFIFTKGLNGSQPTITQTNVSDHWPVTRNYRLH
jgi:endonuclease/exonuclease/phosphatase family metal-dependent hydrolase